MIPLALYRYLPTSLLLLFAALLTTAPCYVHAADDSPFMWKWGDDVLVGKSIPTCTSLPVGIIPANDTTTGTPPYYMLAYPLVGTPRVYTLGADPEKLVWVSDYEPHTQMLLQVVDSHGQSGGIESEAFLSVEGKNTTCVISDPAPASSSSSFTLSANMTGPHDDLDTCDFWGLTVQGGTWPYTFSLVAAGSDVVTNVTTVSSEQDELVYVNRADPGVLFLAAASDSTGKYAYANVSINTAGSADVTCRGRGTTLGNSKQLAQKEKDRLAKAAQENEQKRTKIIIIIVVVVVALLVLGASAWWFLRRRRKEVKRREMDFVPRVFETGHSPAYTSDFDPYSNTSHPGTFTSLYPTQSGGHQRQSSNVPLIARTKREEMAMARERYSDSQQQQQQQQQMRHSAQSDGRNTNHPRTRRAEGDAGDEDEIVIQHRDGGALNVREVPPSYAELLGAGAGGPGLSMSRGPRSGLQPVGGLLHVASGASESASSSTSTIGKGGRDRDSGYSGHERTGSSTRLLPEKGGWS